VFAQEHTDATTRRRIERGASLQPTSDCPAALHPAPPAITNLFYWNNILHDLFYAYGWRWGKLQENNYGKAARRPVNADAQDGSGINSELRRRPWLEPAHQMFLFSTGPDHQLASSIAGAVGAERASGRR
jgi:hypothetical protein